MPRSPVKKPASHSTYRTGQGRSSPSSARSAATFSGVAVVPSMAVAGSPEIMEKAAKAKKETMTMVKSSMAMRLAAYFMVLASLSVRHIACRRSYQAV